MAALLFLLVFIFIPTTIFARYTPEDTHQEKRNVFESSLSKIQDISKKEKVKSADKILIVINQTACDRFEEDVNKLAAIMDELRNRQNVTETRVAFGGVDTPIEQADYWVNFAAEAIAYQRIQDYTPIIDSETGLPGAITSSMNSLKGDLLSLSNKVIRAKTQVKKALNYAK